MSTNATIEIPEYTRKDFQAPGAVKWCPGCGDHSVLASITNALPRVGKRKEEIVFVSGIGCSSRFPYYLSTYGFHTIHGRAPAVATGVKLANPNLSVWVITGDGDALSIGGNHFLHAVRRNQDLKILVFNNRIYGLTKGQFSPTSAQGTKSKTSPYGSIDYPLSPLAVALAAGATFVARTADNDPKHMTQVFEAAASHKGVAVVEILQNCIIFADKVHEDYYGRTVRDETMLYLEDGKPLLFGKEQDKVVAMEGMTPRVVPANTATPQQLAPWSLDTPNCAPGLILANLPFPEFPVVMGVLRREERESFTELYFNQSAEILKKEGRGTVRELLTGKSSWTVK
jgi:2-oxoglutarate ferredoxin oxidoreductase subunit beta